MDNILKTIRDLNERILDGAELSRAIHRDKILLEAIINKTLEIEDETEVKYEELRGELRWLIKKL